MRVQPNLAAQVLGQVGRRRRDHVSDNAVDRRGHERNHPFDLDLVRRVPVHHHAAFRAHTGRRQLQVAHLSEDHGLWHHTAPSGAAQNVPEAQGQAVNLLKQGEALPEPEGGVLVRVRPVVAACDNRGAQQNAPGAPHVTVAGKNKRHREDVSYAVAERALPTEPCAEHAPGAVAQGVERGSVCGRAGKHGAFDVGDVRAGVADVNVERRRRPIRVLLQRKRVVGVLGPLRIDGVNLEAAQVGPLNRGLEVGTGLLCLVRQDARGTACKGIRIRSSRHK